MKFLVLCCFVAVAGVAWARPNEQYSTKYDNINLQEILSNPRLLIPYILCVLEEGRCTAEGKELKSHIRDALETHCSKCSEAQQNGTRKVIAHLINHEAEYWNKLKAKYDPTGKYSQEYEKEYKTL